MKPKPSPDTPQRRKTGMALVIVLVFVVLITGLVVAFILRALNSQQVATSGTHQTRVDVLARSAMDIIIGDLKTEITNGSTVKTVGTGTGQSKVYLPTSAANAVPQRSGNPASSPDPIPNLVRRSVRSDAIASPGVPSRASALSSLDTVSAARWNRHYLIPRSDAGDDIDSTPNASAGFEAPDWVLLTREGPAVQTSLGSGADTLGNAAPENGKYVIGRYAYAIYDEGGLLDLNVAGHPSLLAAQNLRRKGTSALADLTRLPVGKTGTPAYLAQPQVDNLVGWRNYASAQPGGAFAAFTFNATSATRWFDRFVTGNTGGFMSVVSSTGTTTAMTDQALLSRQQLIKLSRDLGIHQNALQYLGTFSRSLNQPSYAPAVTRPKIVGGAAGGGNDGYTGDDLLNPSFLEIRTGGVFTRNDGTQAKSGEPLVKQRFALNRLAWLTYEGPSATAPATVKATLVSAGIPTTLVTEGTAANILKYFGLSWSAAQKRWEYKHGASSTSGPIMTLSQVAALGAGSRREADFFELLKAGLNAGSLARNYYPYTSGSSALTPDGYQCQRDSSLDAAVMEIAANIIDQFDADGFPTRILFNDGSLFGGLAQEYRGIEDLPYLYRVREGKIMLEDSNPSQANLPAVGVTLVTPGKGMVVQQPELWNPHAWSSPATVTRRPSKFRIVAVSADPNNVAPGKVSINVQWRHENGNGVSPAIPVPIAITESETALEFDIPLSPARDDLFREPTLLVKPGIPAGSNLRAGSGHAVGVINALFGSHLWLNNSVTDDKKYLGIMVAKDLPMAWSATIPANGITTGTPATAQAGVVPAGFAYQPSVNSGLTYRVQYQDTAGNWVTYDEKYSKIGNANSYNNYGFRKTFYRPGTAATDGGQQVIGYEMLLGCVDPRTARFGLKEMGPNGHRGNGATQWPVIPRSMSAPNPTAAYRVGWAGAIPVTGTTLLNAIKANAFMTSRPDEYQGFIFSTYDGMANAFGYNSGPTSPGWYPAAVAKTMIRPGMLVQNNPGVGSPTAGIKFNGDNQSPGSPTAQFFADADGVIRRGMSAYVAPNSLTPATAPPTGAASGLPLKSAHTYDGSNVATPTDEIRSRPVMLNRPFRTVAELGSVFSGTPWRSLDFATPESGSVALLDVFCIQDSDHPRALVAGKVNLNTRQAPVLDALLSGAYKSEMPSTSLLAASGSASAEVISTSLVSRTGTTTAAAITAGGGPLVNVADLVGRWRAKTAASGATAPSDTDGSRSYSGFIGTETTAAAPPTTPANLSDVLGRDTSATGYEMAVVQRYRESVVRALVDSGQTRVWNLFIDIVAQSGGYPRSATGIDGFAVKAEQRYWVHLALDRLTGEVLDQQVEVVRE